MSERDEYVQAAELAGLRYVDDDEPGFVRKRWGRGFTYLDSEGDHVRDPEVRARLESLVIPPAWSDVWICADERGHIQATGRDDAGRKQYIYHERWEDVRNDRKFDRLAFFARDALPTIRERYDTDMRCHCLCQKRVVALAIYTLDKAFFRVGSPRYERDHGSHGLTTFRNEHVAATSTRVIFDFLGKSGKEQHLEITDRRLARQVRCCLDLPGQHLFSYRAEDGSICSVNSQDINEYIGAVADGPFTAKDFRTWGGTITAAQALLRDGPPENGDAEERIRDAVASAAERLGNTVAVCREYYIHPALFEGARDGTLWDGKLPDPDSRPEVEEYVAALLD